MMYMVMNRETAECDVFGNEEAAENNLQPGCFIFPCDDVNCRKDAELLLYPNTNKQAKLSWVAEYQKDLCNDDLETATTLDPIKFMRGDL